MSEKLAYPYSYLQLQYKIDKRGKPIQETSAENLKKYYRISYKEKKKMKLERKKERNSKFSTYFIFVKSIFKKLVILLCSRYG